MIDATGSDTNQTAAEPRIERVGPDQYRCPVCGEVVSHRLSGLTRCQKCELDALLAKEQALKDQLEANAAADAARRQAKRQQDQRRFAGETARRYARRKKQEIDPVQAKIEAELASRTLAQRSLLHYIERFHRDYQAGWVHEDLCRRLEKFVRDVEERKSPRLMLWLPPRSGKSEIASARFPAWVLGKHPNWEFIMASYAQDLPLSFSRRVRAQLQSAEFRNLFPKTVLAKDSQSAESWRTTAGGGLRAAGVGGGITGMGAHCFVIDDPVKDQEQADSEVIREAVWDWYSSTAYTRLAPGGGMLIIQTRWSDDDLSGRLEARMREALRDTQAELDEARLALRDAATTTERGRITWRTRALHRELDAIDRWEIVSYPALAIDDEYLDTTTGAIVRLPAGTGHARSRLLKPLRRAGEALHPERFPLELLLKYRRTLEPRHWSALYQQQPVPDTGLIFTAEMFRFRPHLPEIAELYTFAAWDLAIGTKSSNDYTVGVVGGLDADDNLWVLDLIRGRWGDTHQIATLILDTGLRYNCVLTGVEKGQLELALKPHLERVMKERRAYLPLAEGESALRPITDKVVRARPLQGRMQQGMVVFPQDQPWVDTIKTELLRFPAGTHDDIVDALSWLARLVRGHAPPPRTARRLRGRSPMRSWRDRLHELTRAPEAGSFMAR